jgi:hypothetical protein
MFLASQVEYRVFFLDNPKMMEWYLASRGYRLGSEDSNRRTLYVLVRLNAHESSYLSYASGLIDEDVWAGWLAVIRTDFTVKEFIQTWPHAKQFYARSFGEYIDHSILGISKH